ncbi:MAG: riboflavin biosynthesis protein RibD, partial [Planctomycetota bacterium]
MRFESETAIMQRALQLASRGFGFVEPNPQVGAVIVSPERDFIAEGWHSRFGGPHAEIHAI